MTTDPITADQDGPPEAATMVAELRTGVHAALKCQEEAVDAILTHLPITIDVPRHCRRIAAAIGEIGVTIALLAMVRPTEQSTDEKERRERDQIARNLTAVHRMAIVRSKCKLDVYDCIVRNIEEIRELLDLKE